MEKRCKNAKNAKNGEIKTQITSFFYKIEKKHETKNITFNMKCTNMD